MGRKHNCFLNEIAFKIGEYQHGTSPNQQKPVPGPTPPPSPDIKPQPDQSTQPQPSKPDTITPPPTPDPSRPSTPDQETKPKPEEEKPKPATPEELEIAKYDKLLSRIKGEINPDILKDGEALEKEINALNEQLLTLDKQPQFLHDARRERRNNLLDKEKEQKWQT